MADPLLFDRELLLATLDRLDQKLQAQGEPEQVVIVVGGSYLALTELRAATRDIDVVTPLSPSTAQAIGEIAAEQGLSPRWMNDSAVGFQPVGLTAEQCAVAFEGTVLTVLIPSADWVFLMKLDASRAVDRPDLVRLWPHTGFRSAEEAVARYWDAYPHAPDDEHLAAYVAEIAAQAAGPRDS